MTAHSSIFDHILGRLDWGHRPLLLDQTPKTYADLLVEIESLVALFEKAGITTGMPIAVCLDYGLEYIAVILACYARGAVCVLMYPKARPTEQAHILQDAGVRYVVTQAGSELETQGWLDSNQMLQRNHLRIAPLAQPSTSPFSFEKGDLFTIYTSGSTNQPKGVVLTDQCVSANVRGVADYLALSPQDSTVISSPPMYTFAISQVFTHLWAGGSIRFESNGMLTPSSIARAIQTYRLTGVYGSPTTHHILTSIDVGPGAYDSVRYVGTGGQIISSALVRTIYQRFRNARVFNSYGCTENSPRASFNWMSCPPIDESHINDLGQPVRGTKLRIADEHGAEVPPGTIGQVLIAGESLMRCYVGPVERTRERFIGEWYCTSDMGYFDNCGHLYLVGRADNVMNVGNNKVSPEEIEAVLAEASGVSDIGVAPLADEIMGDIPVVLVTTHDPDEEALIDRLHTTSLAKLSSHKQPHRFEVVDQIPRTPHGKIDRRRLKLLVAELIHS